MSNDEKDPSKYYLSEKLNSAKIIDRLYSRDIDQCQQISQFYSSTNGHGFVVFQTMGNNQAFRCHLLGFPNGLYISTEKTNWNPKYISTHKTIWDPKSLEIHSCDVSIESFKIIAAATYL